MFGMCINKRVVIGVAAVALALLAFAPGLLGRLAPVLVMAICPLSMVFMMRGMGGHRAEQPAAGEAGDGQLRGLEEEVNRLKAELALRDENRPA